MGAFSGPEQWPGSIFDDVTVYLLCGHKWYRTARRKISALLRRHEQLSQTVEDAPHGTQPREADHAI